MLTTTSCGSLIPKGRQPCLSPGRRRDNLALGLQVTVETRRGRVGLVSLRRRSRRRRRLEMCGFDNGDEVVVCLMREFIDDSELPGNGARQKQADAQVYICLIRRHTIFFHSRRLQQLLFLDYASIQIT